MLYKLKRTLVWLRRWRHSRGFGVQSPSAYRFIRYVVNEHYPYYAYADLDKEVRGIGRRQRKLFRLYFRLANHAQAGIWLNYGPDSEACRRYVQAGCRKTAYQELEPGSPVPRFGVARLSLTGDYRKVCERLMASADSQSILVVEGIKRSKETKAFWNDLTADLRTGITFDLYYCGIVCFDLNRYKQHYIVNF